MLLCWSRVNVRAVVEREVTLRKTYFCNDAWLKFSDEFTSIDFAHAQPSSPKQVAWLSSERKRDRFILVTCLESASRPDVLLFTWLYKMQLWCIFLFTWMWYSVSFVDRFYPVVQSIVEWSATADRREQKITDTDAFEAQYVWIWTSVFLLNVSSVKESKRLCDSVTCRRAMEAASEG